VASTLNRELPWRALNQGRAYCQGSEAWVDPGHQRVDVPVSIAVGELGERHDPLLLELSRITSGQLANDPQLSAVRPTGDFAFDTGRQSNRIFRPARLGSRAPRRTIVYFGAEVDTWAITCSACLNLNSDAFNAPRTRAETPLCLAESIRRFWMEAGSREIYVSSNGDRWLLVKDGDRAFVRHVPNPSSGGHASDIELEAFLVTNRNSPQGQALIQMTGTPVPDEPGAHRT
jgi:hypothetical protein